jgi:hypothetical protein
MELSVWKCKSGKLYNLCLNDKQYVAKHLISLEFLILLEAGNKKPIHVRYSFGYNDRVYTYKTAKERVQEQMESRAHQIIIRNILGDPNFSWV